ncbi:FAD-NAD(P)-binding protein [Pedobacter duraquae]|uniref:FAD-NAD(P)-binding protein n=2 Tax=Pedobacter duraquae TaxID=425511 RepID=A0A4R6IHM9_9SPHI|nr:FAD-NAD(P)-binding protein [Pedobacter duraquae]
MGHTTTKKRIAILGGGPSGLFMYKRLVEASQPDFDISIFERKGYLGSGMPYSLEGANDEHITNVSDNEIPVIFNSIHDWVKMAPEEILNRFHINSNNFNEYKVLPRLFFGEYLSAQFELLRHRAAQRAIATVVYLNTSVTDIVDDPEKNRVKVTTDTAKVFDFDCVIVCTGHNWPKKFEGKIPGYFDSPYPPKKLKLHLNNAVGIKGSSLTAIDAIRTLARENGTFREHNGRYFYDLAPESAGFSIVMHSRNGLLPAVRFHLEDSHLGKDATLSKEEIKKHISGNGGFIALDFIFEKNFKAMFPEKDPDFYERIKDMSLEAFVNSMMNSREKMDPFELFKLEYAEAEKSIQRKESIYWKEVLAVLSFAMNYPAKYLSAEDMQRLQNVLMPLISVVIAFVPQSSCRDLMALHDAGLLNMVTVDDDSTVEPNPEGGAIYSYIDNAGVAQKVSFDLFVDCVGQPHLSYADFPFKSLIESHTVSPALLQYKSASVGQSDMKSGNKLVEKGHNNYYLKVPGITINDNFQVINATGEHSERIYMMAVPYIGGYNPDYSGIDFCEAASETVAKAIMQPKES